MIKNTYFFDSIQTRSKINNFVEDYFYLGRTFKKWKYEEYILDKNHQLIRKPHQANFSKKTAKIHTFAIDLLKILSYFTVIIPFALLLKKYHFRKSLAKQLIRKPNRSPSHKPLNFNRQGIDITVKNDKKKPITHNIPPEIMSHILDYAVGDMGNKQKVERLTKIAGLNKGFFNVCHSKIKDLIYNSSDFNIPRGFDNLDAYLKYIFKSGLTQIDFSKTRVTNKELTQLAKTYSQELKTIESLSLYHDPDVLSDKGLSAILKACQNLKHLAILKSKFSSVGLKNIGKYIPKLLTLNLADAKIPKTVLKNLAKTLIVLKRLDMSNTGPPNKKQISDSEFNEVLSRMKNLTELNIQGQSELAYKTIASIPKCLPNLRHLDVSFTNTNKSFFSNVATLLPGLISLGITGTNVHDDDLESLGLNLTQLQTLKANYCKNLKNLAEDHISNGFPSLKKLNFESECLTDKGLKKIATNHADLVELTVGSNNLTVKCIGPVVKQCKQLKTIKVFSRAQIVTSKKGLIQVFQNLHKIKNIEYKLKGDILLDVPRLTKNTPHLRTLDFLEISTKYSIFINNPKNFNGLTSLNLYFLNKLSYRDFEQIFTNIPTLRILSIPETITLDLNCADMMCNKLPRIQKLYLHEKSITKDGLKQLCEHSKNLEMIVIFSYWEYDRMKEIAKSLNYPGLLIKVKQR